MKKVIQILLSIFFAIAIGTHIYNVIEKDGQPFWWHCIYYATYGICWFMLFFKNKMNKVLKKSRSVSKQKVNVAQGSLSKNEETME